MAYSYVVYKCSCETITRYRAGQHFFFCTGCNRRYQANPRARIVSYSTRPDPRWRFKFKKYRYPYPNPNTTLPGNPTYYVPQTPPPIMTPADFHVTNPMPQPLPVAMPAPTNMPPMPGARSNLVMPPSLATDSNKLAVAKKTSAGKVIAGLLGAAAVIAIAATLLNNNTGECAAARKALRSWSDCSPSERTGYNYCYVVNIYGEPGHGYVPKGCPSP